MSRAGRWSRKLPARTYSTSWHSAGEALCTDTARGRLLVVAIATIFVPLPRRVGPTAKPPFWRSRKWHPRMPRLGSTDRAHGGAAPVAAAPVPASHSVPIAGTGGGRSGKADIFRAVHANCAPVPNTQSTPCRTARVSCHGRPRLSARRSGRSTGSTTAHCSSVRSQRPRIGAIGDQQSVSRMPSNRL